MVPSSVSSSNSTGGLYPSAGRVGVESKVGESQVESAENIETRIGIAVGAGQLSKAQIAIAVGKKKVDGQLHSAVRELLTKGFLEHTLPDKPNSRLQKYRLTDKGRMWLEQRTKESG